MESLFERVTLRDDVLSGDLTEAKFAASLEEVTAGTAPDTYQDAETFFAGTFPSGGLRTLLNETLGRLGGGKPDGASVIRLETSLGGGKTHNLIALYHAAAGKLPASMAGEFMDPGLLPAEPIDRIGVFVGSATGATSFPLLPGSPREPCGVTWPCKSAVLRATSLSRPTTRRSPRLARTPSRDSSPAPGAAASRRNRAVLPGSWRRQGGRHNASGADDSVPDGAHGGRRRAGARGPGDHDRPGVTDAFGDETSAVLDAISQARSLMARKELVLPPSEEADLPKILTRRLFKPVQPGAAGLVGSAYANTADAAYSAGLDLPEGMTGAGWATEVSRTYPFHPALIRVLDKRLSTIPNFQRTRGALRLLARAVRRPVGRAPRERAANPPALPEPQRQSDRP